MTGLVAFIGGIISITALVPALISLRQVSRGGQANLPIAKGLAEKTFN